MIKFIDVTGKTEDEAIQSALAQLKMDRDDAVSYTHLDVYKRQAQHVADAGRRLFEGLVARQTVFIHGVQAVSYTHLCSLMAGSTSPLRMYSFTAW